MLNSCWMKKLIESPMRIDMSEVKSDYDRNMLTSSGEVELKVPKLRTLPFETNTRRKSGNEEAVDMMENALHFPHTHSHDYDDEDGRRQLALTRQLFNSAKNY